MKKLAIIFFVALAAIKGYSQGNPKTDAELKTLFDVIRNETATGGNTKVRVANAYQALADSKISIKDAIVLSGTNTYTGTVSGLTSYSQFDKWPVQFTNANSGASTVNLSSIGAIPLKKNGSSALVSGDINALQFFWLVYDGTNFQLIGGGSSSGGGDALVANPLSQFASTTSAQLAGVLSNETGTGVAVFSASPTFTGVPLAPTPSLGTNTTQIATSASVLAEIANASITVPISLSNGGLASSLSDPGAHSILGWDDTGNIVRFMVIGSGLTYTQATNTLSSSGGGGGWGVTGNTNLTGATTITESSTNTVTFLTPGLGVTFTRGFGLAITNATAAALGAQQQSGIFSQIASGWGTTGSAPQEVAFHTRVLPVQGTTPTGQWIISSQLNAGTVNDRFLFKDDGALTLQNGGSVVVLSAPNLSLDYGANTGTIKTNSIARITLTTNGNQTYAQSAQTTGSPTAFTWTAGAHTTLTLSTEATDVNFNLARTVQFATGALTTQRAFRIQAPTYGFVGASTITAASTLAISGSPIAGTNATLTNSYALNVESGKSFFGGAVTIPLTPTVSTDAASKGYVDGLVLPIPLTPDNGGTGIVNNAASTLAISGAFPTTLTVTASTSVTLPTSGTLMTNPMTTTGDIILAGASGVPARLAIGANTFVLTSNGTTAAWAAAAGGGTGWSVSTNTTITGNTSQTGAFTNTFAMNGVTITQNALSSGWIPAFKITQGAHTAMTAATEFVGTDFDAFTWTWNSGTTATERFRYFRSPTINSTSGTATFTDAYNVYIDRPIAGTTAAFTNGPWALGLGGQIRQSTNVIAGGVGASLNKFTTNVSGTNQPIAYEFESNSNGTGTGTAVAIAQFTYSDGGTKLARMRLASDWQTGTRNYLLMFPNNDVGVNGPMIQADSPSPAILTYANAKHVFTGIINLAATQTFFTVTQPVSTGGSPVGFLYTGAAHTTLATGTEITDANFDASATATIAGSTTLALNRTFLFKARTFTAASATTWTKASTVDITGPPVGGGAGPLTITTPLALNVESGTSNFSGPVTLAMPVVTSGSPAAALTSTGAAHTTVTASAFRNAYFNYASSVQFTGSTGFSLQTSIEMLAPTYTFASATGTITTANNVRTTISNGGTNSVLTTSVGIHADGGSLTNVTTGISLRATAPTGATTNLAIESVGLIKFSGTNSTGAGSAALGANSPAVTNTAPYTWLTIITSDGSTAYIPVWK